MPHSIAPNVVLPPKGGEEDAFLPDAPSYANGAVKVEDNDALKEDEATSDEALQQEVKLEDLFDDEVSDDEEFPSSSIPDGKVESSPLAAPM